MPIYSVLAKAGAEAKSPTRQRRPLGLRHWAAISCTLNCVRSSDTTQPAYLKSVAFACLFNICIFPGGEAAQERTPVDWVQHYSFSQ